MTTPEGIQTYPRGARVSVTGHNGEALPKSLKAFRSRMCDCGNPICFGTLSSQDVAWLLGVAESYKSLADARKRNALNGF